MKQPFDIKTLVLCIIICGGTYLLTHSLSITAGVAILLYVLDRVLGAWADKKDKEYFNKDQDNGETH